MIWMALRKTLYSKSCYYIGPTPMILHKCNIEMAHLSKLYIQQHQWWRGAWRSVYTVKIFSYSIVYFFWSFRFSLSHMFVVKKRDMWCKSSTMLIRRPFLRSGKKIFVVFGCSCCLIQLLTYQETLWLAVFLCCIVVPFLFLNVTFI
jgi:hypothetical protein